MVPLAAATVDRLLRHAECLERWSDLTSLVGRGDDDLVERHYLESLAGVELCRGAGCLLDLGSGAGFPGLVLAAALPEVEVHLVEARQRKAAFLRQAARAMGLERVRVHATRLDPRAGGRLLTSQVGAARVDCLTLRAVRLDDGLWSAVEPALAGSARLVRWEGEEPPALAVELELQRRIPLAGASQRAVACYLRHRSGSAEATEAKPSV